MPGHAEDPGPARAGSGSSKTVSGASCVGRGLQLCECYLLPVTVTGTVATTSGCSSMVTVCEPVVLM